MSSMEVVVASLFWVFVIGAFGIRLFRTRSATLVLQKFLVGVHPQPSASPMVEIVGRMQGVIAFVLSLMGFSPTTRLTLAGLELRCESTSLFGQRLQLIPIRQVSNLAAGIHKPIGNLISAAVINVSGLSLSWTLSSFWPITVTLVVGIALVVLYAISKKFFVEIHSQGGPPISLLFKPNILEGVPIDAESAMAVVGVIRDLVMASGPMPTGFGGYGGAIPPAPTSPSAPRPIPVSAPDKFNPDTFQIPTKEIHDSELSEVVIEDDDRESYDPSPEETEAAAQTLLTDAKELAAAGNRRKAVEILKAIVSECSETQAAQQARKTLERSGIQV